MRSFSRYRSVLLTKNRHSPSCCRLVVEEIFTIGREMSGCRRNELGVRTRNDREMPQAALYVLGTVAAQQYSRGGGHAIRVTRALMRNTNGSVLPLTPIYIPCLPALLSSPYSHSKLRLDPSLQRLVYLRS